MQWWREAQGQSNHPRQPRLCSCTARSHPLSLPLNPVHRENPVLPAAAHFLLSECSCTAHSPNEANTAEGPLPQRLFSSPVDIRAPPPPHAARARRQDPVLGKVSEMWLAAGCTATYIRRGTVMVPVSPGGMRLARAEQAWPAEKTFNPALQEPTVPLLQLWIALSAHNALRPCFAPAPVLTSS